MRPAPLPAYSGELLSRLEPRELIGLLTSDEDRVPRIVIDECAQRGEGMVLALERMCDDDRASTDEESHGEWWLPLHAVFILGLIASQEAGLLLVRFMRRMAQDGDDDLQDWLSGYWPALFRNKPDSAVDAVRGFCLDRALDWYARIQGVEVVAAAAHARGGAALEATLDWLAAIAADEQEEFMFRVTIGNGLLDLPRARRRADEFRRLAQRLLEGRARYRSTVVESTKTMLERSRNKERDPDEEARRGRMDELKARPEVRALLARQLEGHYATWPETSLPVLGGRSPLEAVRDTAGREMVEALVVDIERLLTEYFPGSHDAIVARLRQRLGLEFSA